MTAASVPRLDAVDPRPRPALSGSRFATPEQALGAFADAVRRGDSEAGAACFSREACLVTPDATAIRGRAEIARILAQVCALRIELHVQPLAAPLIAGDTALSSERWTVRSGPAGTLRLVQAFGSRTVLRHLEGGWKLTLAAPWGWR